MDIPPEVVVHRFAESARHARVRNRDVVLESARAEQVQQLLQIRDVRDAGAAKRLQGILRELAPPA